MRIDLIGLGVALLIAAASLAHFSSFLTDDAFISLRYARHLAAGHGIVWNVGEAPVEGYSNFLYVVLGAAAVRLDLSPIGFLRFINWLSALGIVVLLHAYVSRVTTTRGLPTAAALIGAVHVPLAFWAASGLETATYAMLAMLAIYLYVLTEGRARTLSALVFLLVALTRPEGVVFFGAAALIGLWREGLGFIRSRIGWLSTFAALFGLYTLWRLWYFGALFPTSVHYKAGTHGAGEIVLHFVRNFPFVMLLAAIAPFWRRGAAGILPAAIVAITLAIFWNVSPVLSYFHRFLVPMMGFAVILAMITLDELPKRIPVEWLRLTTRALPVVTILVWSLLNPHTGVAKADRAVDRLSQRFAGRMKVAALIHARTERDVPVAVGDVGVIGYLLPNPIIDLFGLNSRDYADRKGPQRLAYHGEIPDRRPAAIVLVSRKRDTFKHHYLSGWVVAKRPAFAEHYSQDVTRIRGSGEYYYWIHFDSQRKRGLRHALEKVPRMCRTQPIACIEPMWRKINDQ